MRTEAKGNKRKNSFVGVEVLKPVDEARSPLEIWKQWAGGPHGRHVNRTERAVGVIHAPTEIQLLRWKNDGSLATEIARWRCGSVSAATDWPADHPVTNESYAIETGQKHNTRDGGNGYVMRFRMEAGLLGHYHVQTIGASLR
jgi:hypothetical protein